MEHMSKKGFKLQCDKLSFNNLINLEKKEYYQLISNSSEQFENNNR